VTNISYGDAYLEAIQNPDPGVGYASYTIRVHGEGINCLGGFQITGDIYQVWTAEDTQSEWINNPNGNTPGDPMDSYVLFGDSRFGTATIETIYDGGLDGLGTLNNMSDDPEPTPDAYFVLGEGPGTPGPHDLLKLVVPDGEWVTVELEVCQFTIDNGVPSLVPLGIFFGEDALEFEGCCLSPVPEPSMFVLFGLGLLSISFTRPRRK
jgi:hypothetical protein